MPRYSIIVSVDHTYEVEADDMDQAKSTANSRFESEMDYVPHSEHSSYEVQDTFGDELGDQEPGWDDDDRKDD